MKTVVFFDGVCNLCNGVVQWLIERDDHDALRFAPLQSDLGKRLQKQIGQPELDSIIVVDRGKWYVKSDAALLIASKLNNKWRYLRVLNIVPKRLRDVAYDSVAHNRKRIFGERNACMVPTPRLQRKFLNEK
ncbi:putative DCC family thiol-disulfide oxidoreductase YuxK [Alkalibacillus flavidus]|uniref:DCC family thiol-disulfide oxidoreductase YuxK n=1 Tax=Alkalibacillus flavidus TaxID=546021 RepID=A0ABV2KRH1_9BACI